jgi:LemA protein
MRGTISADQITAMAGAEVALGGALGKLIAVAEAYPDLKANTNFAQLQSELSDTENKIQAARRFYNGTCPRVTTGLQMFPGNIVGRLFNFALHGVL